MPIRSNRISPEDLEHAEDKYLDFEFDEALRRENDDLMPISGGEKILAGFFGDPDKTPGEEVTDAGSTESRENNKALEIAARMSEDDSDENEIPVLPDNPSEQDLLEYASRHPAIRSVARLFRGKVVSVRKKS